MKKPSRRLVLVVRADPVICGHSGEARSLAEVALTRGFDDVRIVTWPLSQLEASGLPLKPLDHVLEYSPGITVERPGPVGDYRVVDGRYVAGVTGRLIELFTDGVPTVAMSLYISPHANAVAEAKRVAEELGRAHHVTTIAEAVGSDVTNVVREALESGRIGAAASVMSTYLSADHCVAVSEFTKELIVEAAEQVDERLGSSFAGQCERRIGISYPAINASAFVEIDPDEAAEIYARRGLRPGGYVMFLSRLASAKGIDDLINGYAASAAKDQVDLVIAGRGPQEDEARELIDATGLGDKIHLLLDVDDAEKPALMAGSAAYVLPSRPQAEFTETFGIALVEKMLAGGGPVITCPTGGIPEAVGDNAILVPVHSPEAITAALDEVVLQWDDDQRAAAAERARAYALQFDRQAIFDRLMAGLTSLPVAGAA